MQKVFYVRLFYVHLFTSLFLWGPLVAMEATSMSLIIDTSSKEDMSLVALFLLDLKGYQKLVQPIGKDVRGMLAAMLLHDHPLVRLLRVNLASLICEHTLEGHAMRVRSAEFNPSGNKIVTASSDKIAKIWDAASGKCLYTLEGHSGVVRAAQFNSLGDKLSK